MKKNTVARRKNRRVFITVNRKRGKHVCNRSHFDLKTPPAQHEHCIKMKIQWKDKCEPVHWMSFIKAAVHRERKNTFWVEDGVMNVPFFCPLSPSSLIFCQHKLWWVTCGNKEAEREVILLAACRSNNLFCGPCGFSRTLKAALLNASRLTLKCCFHPHIPGKAECLSH